MAQKNDPHPQARNAISPEQRDYILAHLNHRPRLAVAREAGVSVGTVYRLVRLHGGEMRHDLARRNPEWEAIVRRHYPHMAGHEIERRFGITPNRANKIAADLGLRHSPETLCRLRREERERLRQGSATADRAKRAAKWKARRRLDEMRLMQGEGQKTKFRFKARPLRTYKAAYYLVRAYGYIPSDADPFALFYGPLTQRRTATGNGGRRNTRTEAYYAERYRLTFLPLPEAEETNTNNHDAE